MSGTWLQPCFSHSYSQWHSHASAIAPTNQPTNVPRRGLSNEGTYNLLTRDARNGQQTNDAVVNQ